MLQFRRLVSGGVITNYDCSSKCRHCIYASSPHWPKDYMAADRADEIFRILRRLGCNTVHIGGGEPLLRPHQLLPVLQRAKKSGMQVEYIETNASWYKDKKTAQCLLRELQQHGIYTLLISIDPFHNEYIPFGKVKALMEACQEAGMTVFPWMMQFWRDLSSIGDDSKVHCLEEYDSMFGSDYRLQLLKRYGLEVKGRALQTYKTLLQTYTLDEILRKAAPCSELKGIYHFHVDLYGSFVPQSCAGLAVNVKDLEKGATPDKYPILHKLHSKGIQGLYDLAVNQYGYQVKDRYMGKCELCYDIRRFMVVDVKLEVPDLQPQGHYLYM